MNIQHKTIRCPKCDNPLTQTKDELRCLVHGDIGLTGWHPDQQAVVDWTAKYIRGVGCTIPS